MFIEHEEETGRKTIELKSINKSNKTMLICIPPGTILLERFLIHAICSTLIGFKEVCTSTAKKQRSRKYKRGISMYGDMLNGQIRYLLKYIWKIKIPLKIKIFMWFLSKKVLLTRDNLAKRNWNGNTKYCFCDNEKSVEHLFIFCPFAKLI
jgi:hypothetical protein